MFAKLSLTQKGVIAVALPLILQLLVLGLYVAFQFQATDSSAGAGVPWFFLVAAALPLLVALAFVYGSNLDLQRRTRALLDHAPRPAQPAAPHSGSDEIAELDRAFHALADTLAQTQERLRQSEQDRRDLYDNALCGYHSLGPDGTFLAINDTELNWLGYRRDEVIGKLKFPDLLTLKSRERFSENFPLLKKSGAVPNLEYELIRKDGQRIPVLLNATAICDAAGIFLASRSTVFNITDRKRTDEALRRTEQRFRLLVGQVVDYAIVVLNPAGRIVSWNVGAERIIGYRGLEIVGKNFSCLYPPEAIARKWPEYELEATAHEGRFEDEGWRVREDGSRFWANVVLTALYTEDGELDGYCKITRDLTERKRVEDTIHRLNDELEERVRERTADLEEANRELRHKNQENEMFVYSVSHDLRSPLVNLEGFSKELGMICNDLRALLKDEQVPESVRTRGLTCVDRDMAEAVRFIQTAVIRLSNIIDALLRLSRAGRVEYQRQTIDPRPMLTRVVEAMNKTIDERGATIIVHDLPLLWGDPTAIEQVFANLIGNALNYLEPKRPGRVEVSGDRTDDGHILFHVKDNGIGIPEAYQHKIFQAFQRLHAETVAGEGMGLAIVRRIVERHRGKVWVESKVDEGTTFFVALPAPPEISVPQSGAAQTVRRGV